jgi:hypothetical protein
MMPSIEEIIEAILRHQLPDRYDDLKAPEKMVAAQTVLDILIPALPLFEEIKAAAWDEGAAQVMRDYMGGAPYELKPNPYRSA